MLKKERSLISIILILFLLFQLLPYIYGYHIQGEDKVFSGFILQWNDNNTYLAKMNQGAHGNWLFQLDYAQEPGDSHLHLPLLSSPRTHRPLVQSFPHLHLSCHPSSSWPSSCSLASKISSKNLSLSKILKPKPSSSLSPLLVSAPHGSASTYPAPSPVLSKPFPTPQLHSLPISLPP